MNLEELVKQINSLQKQVDGLVKPEVSRWITWTPTITQGVAITIAISFARYSVTKSTVVLRAVIELQSAGTPGSDIVIGNIPAVIQPAQNSGTIGVATVFDSGTQFYVGNLIVQAANDWRIVINGSGGNLGGSPAYTIANGDRLEFMASYEAI